MRDAYVKMRAWYQAHSDRLDPEDGYSVGALNLIRAMPEPDEATDLEIQAIAWEVISGYGEWAFVESDGTRQMHEYAENIVTIDGKRKFFSDQELDQLRKSPLYPLLFNMQSIDRSD